MPNSLKPASDNARKPEGDRDFKQAMPSVALTTLVFFFTYLVRAIFGPLLPDLEKEFDMSHSASTRLLFYISVGYALAVFFSCLSADKVRPRRLVALSAVVCGLVMLGMAAARQTAFLPFLFLALGGAAGAYFNAGFSTVRSLAPPSQWGKVIAAHEVGPNLGLLLAPLLAGFGASRLGWRPTIACLGAGAVAAGALFHFLAKGGENTENAVSLQDFKQALRSPRLWFFVWGIGIGISVHFGLYSVMTLHMVAERHLSVENSAFLLSTSRLASPFAALLAGRLISRLGTRRTLTLAFSTATLSIVLTLLPWLAPFALGLYLQPAAAAVAIASMFTFLAQSFPDKVPLYTAIGMPLGGLIGLGLMPMLLGLWGDFAGFQAGFAMIACLALLTLPLIRRLE
ncbi:MAG: MFS transporter [Desulfovibrio sp.]|jgi:NNP family nitrate/nitrite transporter-like MFS transporter|nr:MFS transporter [Desulfovibrio sp.]